MVQAGCQLEVCQLSRSKLIKQFVRFHKLLVVQVLYGFAKAQFPI